MLAIKHQIHLAKWIRVHFPYTRWITHNRVQILSWATHKLFGDHHTLSRLGDIDCQEYQALDFHLTITKPNIGGGCTQVSLFEDLFLSMDRQVLTPQPHDFVFQDWWRNAK
jgi:hypothetical protein